ncbi:MAG: hypothetical protein ACRYE7_00125 [Janthinobacterium lividum]
MDNSSERVPPNNPSAQYDNNVSNDNNVGNDNDVGNNDIGNNEVGNDRIARTTGVSRELLLVRYFYFILLFSICVLLSHLFSLL